MAAEIECQLSKVGSCAAFGLECKSPTLLEFLFRNEKKLLMFLFIYQIRINLKN